MFNPRTSNELWDDNELEAPLHYPNATRRRALIAHSVGVLGVLGTLALGIAAIGPHLTWVTHRAETLFSAERPAQVSARPVPQVVPLATPPAPETPVVAAPELAVAPPPAEPVATTPPAAEPVATTPPAEPAPATLAPAEPPATTPQPAEIVATQAATVPAPKALAEAPAVEAPTRSVAPVRHARSEPRLTWAEIERRKARYAAWLKSQGLEPVQ